MSLKLSPGCTCCNSCEACSNATIKEEYDVTLAGLSDGTLCNYCDVFNGTFSLLTEGEVLRPATGWAYGWNNHEPNMAAENNARAEDAVAGATSACVWNYKTNFHSNYCLHYDCPICVKSFWMPGLALAKFKISDVSYTWRLIVNWGLLVNCDFLSESRINSGWYWEMTSTTKDCHFDETETWTAYTPSQSVSIFCDESTYTLDRTEFCTGTLSLTSVVDG